MKHFPLVNGVRVSRTVHWYYSIVRHVRKSYSTSRGWLYHGDTSSCGARSLRTRSYSRP